MSVPSTSTMNEMLTKFSAPSDSSKTWEISSSMMSSVSSEPVHVEMSTAEIASEKEMVGEAQNRMYNENLTATIFTE